MATIRAKCNKYGGWVVYVGTEKHPLNESKLNTAFYMVDLIEKGHTVSEKSEITGQELSDWKAADFSLSAFKEF